MAPTATTDDDLLIISDDTNDTSIDDASIDISFDTETSDEIMTEAKPEVDSGEDTIDFGSIGEESEIAEVAIQNDVPEISLEQDIITEEVSVEDAPAKLSLGSFSIGEESQDTVAEVVTENVADTESDFSIGFGAEDDSKEVVTQETPSVSEIVETPVETIVSSPVEEVVVAAASMNVILSDTIAKLEARQEVIATEKDAKSGQVTDIKAQIKALEEEVALHEEEIAELDAESKKIATNVKGLEKMKLDEEVTKEHNSKRVPKA